MTQNPHPETGHPVSDFLQAFRENRLGFLPVDLSLVETGASSKSDRTATLGVDENGDLLLTIFPDGFSKEELLHLRDQADTLIDGMTIVVNGRSHCIALFLSCMIIEDHEVTAVKLTFEVDPFAEQAA